MCGIFTIINHQSEYLNEEVVRQAFQAGQGRGPEHSVIQYYEKWRSVIGFHLLAINAPTDTSIQPIIIGDYALICNGEIYNYKEIYAMMPDIVPTTQSDCEVIIHLYRKYGIDQTLRMLDGVFAFVLYTPSKFIIARDPYGVRPLYYLADSRRNMFSVASELKCLVKLDNLPCHQFNPGYYLQMSHEINGNFNFVKYHSVSSNIRTVSYNEREYENKLTEIYETLKLSVFKRCKSAIRPVACLLSGGLDSSLIASLVNLYMKENNKSPVETYSIGLANSEDVKYARIVADYIGSNHTEIIVTEQDMIDAIPDVIYAIESYDTTTVRASIGNYLVGKYIRENTDAKVIFNGDGSDELCGGYLYMNKCPDNIEFDNETCRLLTDIYAFDVLRSDKSISTHGLEPRTPFLDKHFVNTYLSIPVQHRRHQTIEKFMLRESISGTHLLPDEIVWRKKEAFSDGVSNHGRSLFQIIQEYVKNHYEMLGNDTSNIELIDMEKKYYLDIFKSYYKGQEHIVPYYWMPKYTNATDPSARTLEHYDIKQME